ncbi:PQQ-like beta-propeller repeat protein [Candidatus Woesearchaeota archaeon]|nr:PQQ-like beta-propeller repeat protein [Candidatus Woesearchaeota archaeon]
MKKEVVLVIFLLLVGTVAAQLADSPWPMYHGGVKHGGQSDVDTSHVNGFIKWTFEAGDGIETSPVIGEDGTIYFGAHDNIFYAVNPDGTLKWKFYVGEPLYDDTFEVYKGILSTAAIAKDGTIYFSSLSDIFFALNPDGTEKWRHELPITSDTWTSPVIAPDGTIYIGSARRKLEGSDESEYFDPPIGGIYAFNPDGTLKWRFVVEADMAGSLTIGDDGTIYGYVGGGDEGGDGKEEIEGFIRAINPDGTEKWRSREVFTEASPTIAPDGTIYIGLGHEYRGFLVLNPDGTEKWFFETTNDISIIAGLANDGTVYVGEWDGIFYAFNPDGSIKWTFPTIKGYESLISSPAIGKEGTIFFGAEDGMHALNPDGTEKWHYNGDMGHVVSSPAIGADGTVYVGSWNNKLYAFGEGEIVGNISEGSVEGVGEKGTCPDGVWDENEQANPTICPLDAPNYESEYVHEIVYGDCEDCEPMGDNKKEIPKDQHEEPIDERGFFTKLFDWMRALFK